MARVMTSGSLSRAGRPVFGGCEACSSFHQSSTRTYNETKKESRSSMAPSFGESLVHQHTILAPSRFFAITHQTSKMRISQRWLPLYPLEFSSLLRQLPLRTFQVAAPRLRHDSQVILHAPLVRLHLVSCT